MTEMVRPLLTRLMGQRFIAFYPVLAHLTNSAKCALFLGHALSWTRHYARHEPERDGWFWQTTEQCQSATGLSRHEQHHARTTLCAIGALIEEGRGMPRRTWFRLDLDALATLLATHIGHEAHQWSWSESAVRALLGRPIPVHRPFVSAGGSVTAGIYLGWMCTRMREARNLVRTDGLSTGVWLDVPMARSQANLGMKRRQLEGARATLIRAGLITECWRAGAPARRLTQLNVELLMTALSEPHSTQDSLSDRLENDPNRKCSQGMYETSIPACTKPDNWNVRNEHSSMHETGQQACTKPDNMSAGFVQPLYGVKTSEVTTPNTGGPSQRPSSSSHDQNHTNNAALKLGNELAEHEQKTVRQMLTKLADPTLAQLVADEWMAQCARGVVRRPLSYLSTLIQLASKNQFVPAHALGMAKARRNADVLEAARRLPPPGMQPTIPTTTAQVDSGSERTRPSDETMKTLQELRRRMQCVTTK